MHGTRKKIYFAVKIINPVFLFAVFFHSFQRHSLSIVHEDKYE